MEQVVTKELLKEMGACKTNYIYVCENRYIDLTYKEAVLKALHEDRFSDANWFLTQIMTKKQNVQYAVFTAELVIDIFEKEYPDNDKPRKAIEAAKEYLKNPCGRVRKKANATAFAAAETAAVTEDYAAAKAAYVAADAADAAYAAGRAGFCVAADTCAAAKAAVQAATDAVEIKEKIIQKGIEILNLK